jgi:hypothetical protein
MNQNLNDKNNKEDAFFASAPSLNDPLAVYRVEVHREIHQTSQQQ